jgi:hypothetical protein
MAVIAQSARYGSGLFGVSKFGVTNLSKVLTGVVGTTNTPSLTQTHTSTIVLTGVSATSSLGAVEIFLVEIIVGVSATGAVGSVVTSTSAGLSGVQGTSAVGTISTTAVVFNYGAVRDLYDRRRTVNIERAA